MKLLSDPVWTGISALIALVALGLTIYLERGRLKIKPFGQRFPLALINWLVGIVLISLGFIIQPFVLDTLQGGVNSAFRHMAEDLNRNPIHIFLLALFPGSVTATAAVYGRSRGQKIRAACIAAIVSLSLQDFLQASYFDAPAWRFIFDLFMNIVGGTIAGIIIGYLVHTISEWFAPTTPQKAN